MTRPPQPKTRTRVALTLGLIFALGALAIGLAGRHHLRELAIEEATARAQLVLDRNLAAHHYINDVLEPRLLERGRAVSTTGTAEPGGLFSPYAVHEMERYSREKAGADHEYRECCLHGCASRDMPDEVEKAFIEAAGRSSGSEKQTTVRLIGGKPYLEILKAEDAALVPCRQCGEQAEARSESPAGPTEGIREERQKHERRIAAVSVRIPISGAFSRINRFTIQFVALFMGCLLVTLLVVARRHRAIADNACKGDRPGGTEPAHLEAAFDIADRKRAEDELRKSEERYRGLVEKSPIAISVTRGGRMSYVNPRYVAMFGYDSLEELIGLCLKDILAPSHRDEVVERNKRREAGEKVPDSYETMGMRKDGTTFPMWADAVIIDWEGEPCTFGFLTDLSRRKETELALRQSEERFRLLYEKAPIGYQSLDEEGRILDVNESWLELLGYEKSDVLGKWFGEFLEPRSVERFRESFPRFKATGEISGVCFEMRKRNGGAVAAEFTGKVGHDAWGGFKQTHCVMRDITRQKQAEDALKESERRYRRLFEEAPYAILEEDFSGLARELEILRESGVIDPRSHLEANPAEVRRFSSLVKLVNANKAALDLYGAEDPEELRQGLDRILGEEAHDALVEEIVAIFDGVTKFKAQTYNRTLSGSRKSVAVSVSVLPHQHQSPTRAIVSIIDTTEQRRLEEQLRHAQKMEAVGTLAGGIAHDFNNILAIILGFTELALHETPESTSLRYNLEQVLQASERAKDLVKQILTFSRRDTTRRREIEDLVPAALEAVRFARASLPATIEIRARVPETPMVALADSTQIQQVLINLCTNAAHAMHESGGVLGIEVADYLVDESAGFEELEPGPHIRITVSDTGHGMDRETLSRIFDPYFTTKDVGKGSGLGLATVHGIIQRHGGAVRVYSEPGKGSTFHVFIPKISESPDAGPMSKREIKTGNERILMVDDEAVVLQVGKRLLEKLGYRVETSPDPVLALDAFRETPSAYDLIITDYTMPKLTGDKFAAKILEIRPDIPILLCTGFSEQIDEERAKELGIRRLVMKPLSLRDLAEAVRETLESYQG